MRVTHIKYFDHALLSHDAVSTFVNSFWNTLYQERQIKHSPSFLSPHPVAVANPVNTFPGAGRQTPFAFSLKTIGFRNWISAISFRKVSCTKFSCIIISWTCKKGIILDVKIPSNYAEQMHRCIYDEQTLDLQSRRWPVCHSGYATQRQHWSCA